MAFALRALPAVVIVFGACVTGDSADDGPPSTRAGSAPPTSEARPAVSATSQPSTSTSTTLAPPPPVMPATTVTTPSTGRPSPAAVVPCTVEGGPAEPWSDRPRYDVTLQLDPDARRVTGSLAVRFRPDAPIDRLVFRLWPNAPRPGGAGARLEASDPSVDGHPVIGSYEAGGAAAGTAGTVYSIALPSPVAAGVVVEARLGFVLAMPGVVNDRVSQTAAAMRLGSVIPTLSWVRGEGWTTSPAVDAFAEAAVSEVADYDVTVTAPEGWSVLATGEEREPGRFVALGVRDWAATAGRMRTASTTAEGSRIVVVAGVAEGLGDDPAAVARRAAVALDALASRFGSYPYARLSIGVTSGLSGGIEFPQHIHLGSRVSSVHLVHEVAHQWFYGLVGNDQFNDPWLDEGLATYAEGRVSGRLAPQRRRSLPAAGRGRLGESMAYWEGTGRVYFTSVYVGGLQALGTYADEIGGYEALDCALRRYTRDHTYRVARPEDLFAALQSQTGIDPRPILARFGV